MSSAILIGLAAGDMLGAPTEFLSPAQVREQYGTISGPVKRSFGNYDTGHFTDDTQMALCLLEAYPADAGLFTRAHAALLDWQRANPRDIGVLTDSALVSESVSAWRASGRVSCGNGALVRAAASVAAGRTGEELRYEAVRLGAITHADPRSLVCCLVLCDALERLTRGENYQDAWQAALAEAADAPIAEWVAELGDEYASDVAGLRVRAIEEVTAAVRDALRGTPGGSSGYAVTTLQTAIVHGSAASFLAGVIPIVREGGDSDSIAAVCGAILGARGVLPPLEWLTDLRSAETFSSWPKGIFGEAAVDRLRQACVRATGFFIASGARELQLKKFHPQIIYGRQITDAREAAYLSRAGVTHVLDLRSDSEAAATRIRWPEHAIDRGNVPISDGGTPTRGSFERTHEFIERALAGGGTVYVHCRAGVERTGSILLAWWLKRGGDENGFYARCSQVRPLPNQVEAALKWAYDE